MKKINDKLTKADKERLDKILDKILKQYGATIRRLSRE